MIALQSAAEASESDDVLRGVGDVVDVVCVGTLVLRLSLAGGEDMRSSPCSNSNVSCISGSVRV